MTVALTDGILGLEAKHIWNAGTVLNDLTATPRFKVNRIGGLRSFAEVDDRRAKAIGRPGEIVYPTTEGGRTITYEGVVQARNMRELRQQQRLLASTFRERSSQGFMFVTPNATYGDGAWFYVARVLALDIDEEFTASLTHPRTPYQQQFTLSLRSSDPRHFWHEQASISGGSGTTVGATNLGIAPSDPTFVVESLPPLADLSIENTTTDDYLHFADLPAGDLTVNFSLRQISVDGVDVIGHLLDESTWWNEGKPGLIPGANDIYCGIGPWTCSWYHADV